MIHLPTIDFLWSLKKLSQLTLVLGQIWSFWLVISIGRLFLLRPRSNPILANLLIVSISTWGFLEMIWIQ